MSFLRLGVSAAILDDEGRCLLSRRDDLDIWNLPTGRVDSGERLAEAAAREAREETGIVPHIEHPVGLYYLAGWQRLNVLYVGWPLRGELLQDTGESSANRYFSPAERPSEMVWPFVLDDALAETRPLPRVITTPPDELRRVRWKLRWRWLKNLLAGRPEPRYPRFNVQAVALIWDDPHRRVLTLPGVRARVLPRVICDGQYAPGEQLARELQTVCTATPALHWVGLWQHAAGDSFEFIFAATVPEAALVGEAEWSNGQNAALMGRDAAYVPRVGPDYARAGVWTLDYTMQRPPLDKIEIE